MIIDKAVSAINKACSNQINSNPKYGTIDIKDASAKNQNDIQYQLLNLERQLRGMELV
jgi:hypothetical protein